MSNINLSFDMRAPDLGTSPGRLYSEALAMCEYVDTRGIDCAMVMEHHGAEDGYLPAPFLMGAAIAARTKLMRIQMGAVIDNLEALKKSGIYQVLTPEEAVQFAAEADQVGGDLVMAPLFGGMDPDLGWKSIELCLQKVVPKLVKKPLDLPAS